MPYNGSGVFAVYTPGTPYVTGTTISSTVANNVNSDFATGLSTAITKDGQTTTTATIPFATPVTMAQTLGVTGKTTATGGVKTISGVTASTASGTPVGILNCATYGVGTYIVTAYISGAGTNFISSAIAVNDGSAAVVVRDIGTPGATMALSSAGNLVVNATQTAGTNQIIAYQVLFITH